MPKGPQTYALVARGGISSTSPEAGSIQFKAAYCETSEYAESATIRVMRSSEATQGFSSGSTGELTVTYRTEDGTAEAGEDYEPVSGTLVWLEGDETVTLILEETHGNSWLKSVESAVLIIEANDAGGGGSSGGCFIESPRF